MSNNDKIHITKEGLEEIKKEYKDLSDIKRPRIVERLTEARQMGDLAENNELQRAVSILAALFFFYSHANVVSNDL